MELTKLAVCKSFSTSTALFFWYDDKKALRKYFEVSSLMGSPSLRLPKMSSP